MNEILLPISAMLSGIVILHLIGKIRGLEQKVRKLENYIDLVAQESGLMVIKDKKE